VSARPGIPERLARAVSAALGESPERLSFLYVNGWRMDLSSFTALAFVRGAPEPRLVAKVACGTDRDRVRAERDNLADLSRSALGELAASVPRPAGFDEDEEAAILLESVVPGEPFDPAAAPERIPGFIDLATDWLVRFHRATSGAPAPLAERDLERLLVAPIEEYLRRFRPATTERRLLERTLAAAVRLRGTALPLVWHHDDFGPPNLLLDHGRLGVIDWETRFAPRLPAFDLIHLLACLGVPPAGQASAAGDDLDRYERAFFEDNPLSRAAGRAAVRYAREMSLPVETLHLLFTEFWVVYALEKAEALERTAEQARAAGVPAPDLGVWSLARFEDGTCVNLKRLAERERSIVFP
jgi:aminoglycoside phosphotransferase (APT) family kinase protein